MLAPMPTGRAGALAATMTLTLLLTATGCGVGAPLPADPSGVDGLVIPTPSPRPADFVARVDNPLLPLVPGSRWRYRRTDAGRPAGSVVVTVAEDTRPVAGLAATVVRQVASDRRGEVVDESEAWFAQDTTGNVWFLGRATAAADGGWEAGVDGAEAGLAMPATPRVGDGYEDGRHPGSAADVVLVLDVAAERRTTWGAWDDLLETEVSEEGEPDTRRMFHAPGIGLVLSEGTSLDEVVELVAFTAG